jgi:predicted ATPase/DNA-binding CsgD family transcriptional regulator
VTAIASHEAAAAPEPAPARYRTSFVGRDRELREVVRHLVDPAIRLVTILGRSGVGKTRLAFECTSDPSVLERGTNLFVDIGYAGNADDVLSLLAQALEVAHVPGQSAEDAVRRQLRHAPRVVIADNADLIPDAVQSLVDLVSVSPGSVVLATGQRAAGIAGERVVRLDGFAVPAAGAADTEALLSNPAVVLYADRAAAGDVGFSLMSANVEDVAELVRQLDGLPLAIELGAARSRILSPRAQLAALEQHSPLELRARDGAARPHRHCDVRSAVAVSYEAASDSARLVLRRMSVAADAVTSERVRELVPEPGWTLAVVLDDLAELVELGLADVDQSRDGKPRFRLHPTVAAFGREQLEADGNEPDIRARYTSAVLRTARATRSFAHRPRVEALAEASVELHAAFGWLAETGDAERALELAADLSPLWARRGLFQGPGSTFERLLTAAETATLLVTPATLARAQLWWTRLVIHGSSPAMHRPALVARLGAAVDAARTLGDESLLLFGLDCVVWAVFVTGDMAATSAAVAEGLPLADRLGDRAASRRYTYCTAMLANIGGDIETALLFARPALESALRDGDLIDTIRVCTVLWTIPPATPGFPASVPSAEALLGACLDAGEVVEASLLYAMLVGQAVAAGDAGGAARWAVRGLDLAQQLGAWYAGGHTTAALVLLAAGTGDVETVASLHGSLTPILPEVMVAFGPHAPTYLGAIAGSRERMGPALFDQAVADAAILDRDAAIERAAAYAQAVAQAFGGSTLHAIPSPDSGRPPSVVPRMRAPRRPGHLEQLTRRELDVLFALMTGATNTAIGKSLGLRPKTVMHYSVSVYAKLGVRGRTEATAWAYRNGLAPAAPDDETPRLAAS